MACGLRDDAGAKRNRPGSRAHHRAGRTSYRRGGTHHRCCRRRGTHHRRRRRRAHDCLGRRGHDQRHRLELGLERRGVQERDGRDQRQVQAEASRTSPSISSRSARAPPGPTPRWRASPARPPTSPPPTASPRRHHQLPAGQPVHRPDRPRLAQELRPDQCRPLHDLEGQGLADDAGLRRPHRLDQRGHARQVQPQAPDDLRRVAGDVRHAEVEQGDAGLLRRQAADRAQPPRQP